MKLLAVSNVFPPGFIGGYELGAFELLTAIAARGHQVRVLTSDYLNENGDANSSLEVHRTLEWLTLRHDRWTVMNDPEKSTFINPGNIRRLSTEIRDFAPDVVLLFNTGGLGALGLTQLVDRCGIPFLLYLMDNVFHPLQPDHQMLRNYTSVFGELCYQTSPVTVTMSQNLATEVGRTPGLLSNDVRIVPGWTHPVQLAPPSDEDSMAKFVFCSRIAGHKGIGILEAAVEMTVQQGATNFVCDVYGQGDVPQFIQSVKSRGLERWLRYGGSLDKETMTSKLSEYDALLFPTWEREPYGFVVSEAAAAGCIPVFTSGIGAGEWFVDSVDCLKIERAVEPLCMAIRRVMAMSVAQRLQIKMAALGVAQRTLNFERWAGKVHDMCLELAARPKKAMPDPRAIESAFLFLADLWLNTPATGNVIE